MGGGGLGGCGLGGVAAGGAGGGGVSTRGGGGRRGSQPYLGARAQAGARSRDDGLGVPPPAGGCGRSFFGGRPRASCAAGPVRPDRLMAGAGRGGCPI